jgi:cytochrome c oxidase subunit IV
MISLRTYFFVFAALIGLTLTTTGVAFVDLGANWNVAVALTLAVIKALLVALYFMHLRHSGRVPLIFSIASIGWLGLLMLLAFADYLTRLW